MANNNNNNNNNNNYFNEHADFQDGEMFPLRQAVVNNNIDEVRRLLDTGANVNQLTEAGTSALGNAVHRNYGNIVKLLLLRGANPNKGSPDSIPLMDAINSENLEIIELLLAANATILRKDPNTGERPIQYIKERRFYNGDAMLNLLRKHLKRKRDLMTSWKNVRALNMAMGKNHNNFMIPIEGLSLPANAMSKVGQMLSGSKRKTLKLQTENLKVKASPPPTSPRVSPNMRPAALSRRKIRKSRKHRRTQRKH